MIENPRKITNQMSWQRVTALKEVKDYKIQMITILV